MSGARDWTSGGFRMRQLLILILLFPQAPPPAAPLRLPSIADTQLSMSAGEEHLNGGDRSSMRLKGIEEVSIIDFDVSAIRGKTVEEARLFVVPTGPHKLRS